MLKTWRTAIPYILLTNDMSMETFPFANDILRSGLREILLPKLGGLAQAPARLFEPHPPSGGYDPSPDRYRLLENRSMCGFLMQRIRSSALSRNVAASEVGLGGLAREEGITHA